MFKSQIWLRGVQKKDLFEDGCIVFQNSRPPVCKHILGYCWLSTLFLVVMSSFSTIDISLFQNLPPKTTTNKTWVFSVNFHNYYYYYYYICWIIHDAIVRNSDFTTMALWWWTFRLQQHWYNIKIFWLWKWITNY